MEISYTEGPMNLNWKQIMSTVEGDDRFYMDTEEDEVTPKEAGWEFLRMFGRDDDGDEESEEESVYSEQSGQEESVSLLFITKYISKGQILTISTHNSINSPKRSQRKMTLILRRIASLIMTLMRILKNKEWIGMIWNEKPLQMIEGRREMVTMTATVVADLTRGRNNAPNSAVAAKGPK